jgi:hypothetical protein
MNTAGAFRRAHADPKTSETSKGPLLALIANDFMSRMGGWHDGAYPYPE